MRSGILLFWRLLLTAVARRSCGSARQSWRNLRGRFRSKPAHLRIGRAGEQAVVRFLKQKGCRIVERNYRCSSGEIDIIALSGALIIFVEVKTRSANDSEGEAIEISRDQKRRILRAAAYFLRSRGLRQDERPVRFDVATATHNDGQTSIEEYLKGAFSFKKFD